MSIIPTDRRVKPDAAEKAPMDNTPTKKKAINVVVKLNKAGDELVNTPKLEPLGDRERPSTAIKEEKSHTVAMLFGRMNPPTKGHEENIEGLHKLAKEHNADHVVVASHTTGDEKNPLTPEQKEKHLKRAFPGTNIKMSSKAQPTILHHASELHKQGYKHLIVAGGDDRAGEYHKLLNKYNGVEGRHGHYNFDSITVKSTGERKSGVSGTDMRKHVKAGDFESFKQGLPSKLRANESHAKELFHDVKGGLKEAMEHTATVLEKVISYIQARLLPEDQLDELKSTTLQSYADKAKESAVRLSAQGAKAKKPETAYAKFKKAGIRLDTAAKAKSKAFKKDWFAKFGIKESEEAEQIDEITMKSLKGYLPANERSKGAAENVPRNYYSTPEEKAKAAHTVKKRLAGAFRYRARHKAENPDMYPKQAPAKPAPKTHDPHIDRSDDYTTWSKGRKDTVKEDKEQIDEISKTLKARYVTRAVDSHGHAAFAARMTQKPEEKKEFEKVRDKRAKGINRALGEAEITEAFLHDPDTYLRMATQAREQGKILRAALLTRIAAAVRRNDTATAMTLRRSLPQTQE